jgi:hypothetical protein
MLNQSFRQVFVTNSPALLAQGTTVDLAIDQIGIFDANTYEATVNPTYAKNKALVIAHGTPDLSYLPLMAGIANETEKSKLIKGKLITGWRGKKAHRGQSQIVTIGYDGADTTKTLFGKHNEHKTLYVKLTGSPISKLFSPQGITRMFTVDTGCLTDCEDSCAPLNCDKIADQLISEIKADKFIGKFLRATKLQHCSPAPVTIPSSDYKKYCVSQCDGGDGVSLGIVQAQYPTLKVVSKSRKDNISTYEVTQLASLPAPAPLSNAGLTMIVDCPTCPTGYTLVPEAKVFEVKVKCGEVPALTSQISTQLVNSEVAVDTHIVYVDINATTQTVIDSAESAGCVLVNYIGTSRNICKLDTPSTTAWEVCGTCKKYSQCYQITLQDSVCGTDHLAELQAAYPNLVITLDSNPTQGCVHLYKTEIESQCVGDPCSIESLVFQCPNAFRGISWVKCPDASVGVTGNCVCGIKLESAFVNRTTNECLYDYFPYDADGVHIQVSEFNPDYNGSPCEGTWPITVLQEMEYPSGYGWYVAKEEEKSLSYWLRERSVDPAVRQAEGYHLATQFNKYYDEYTLEFDFKYHVLGWSEKYEDSYHLVFYVLEGQGKQLENAINEYITSSNINLDPVVL